MKVINFIGEPSAGKSATALSLAGLMKARELNAEYVDEHAKSLVLEERHNCLRDQLTITAEQNRKLSRLNGKFDYAIVDSPLFLGIIYAPKEYYQLLKL